MDLNPEFKRNLWTELSIHRLIGMPFVLGAIFLLVFIVSDYKIDILATFALIFFGLLTFIWGTRTAAESIITEIKERTWDSQRMSVLGPWSMTWGKLLGSTIYTWYGALICLVLYLFVMQEVSFKNPLKLPVLFFLCGLLGQSIGLLASMLSLKKIRTTSKSQSTSYMIIGLIVVLTILSFSSNHRGIVQWYGTSFHSIDFTILSTAVFLVWIVFGIYRLMREELQIKSTPIGWLAFVIFLMFYMSGLINLDADSNMSIESGWMTQSYYIALILTYIMVFIEKKDPVLFRKLLKSIKEREWGTLTTNMQCWMVTVIVAIILVFVLCLSASLSDQAKHLTIPVVISMFFFFLRDLFLILFLNLAKKNKRADMAAVLYLALLYGVLPSILFALKKTTLTFIFWPQLEGMVYLSVFASLVEMLLVFGFLLLRWRKAYGIELSPQPRPSD